MNSKHQCRMQASSINQYLGKLTNYNTDEIINLYKEGISKFNHLSAVLCVFKGYAKISKQAFYDIKNLFVYSLYTIATAASESGSMDWCKVNLIAKYKKGSDTVYELEFILDGEAFRITCTENTNVSYGYLEEAFDKILITERTNATDIVLPDIITSDDVWNEYNNLRIWCGEHYWFFTVFYDEMFLYDIFKKVYRDSPYIFTYPNKQSSVKMMFRRPDIIVFHINDGKEIKFVQDSIYYIRDIFHSQYLTKFEHLETLPDKNTEGYKKYSIINCETNECLNSKSYILLYAKCITNLLNYIAWKNNTFPYNFRLIQ